MAVASAILAGVGTGLQVFGQLEAGKAANEQAEFNAQMAENEVMMARQKARFEQKRQAKQSAKEKGRLAAQVGTSGARSDVGAPLVLASEQAVELELENLLIGFEGEALALRRTSEAALTRFGGETAKRSSRIGAGTTLLKGFSSFKMPRRSPGRPASPGQSMLTQGGGGRARA